MKFTKTYCSQCGAEFGAGDEGFSSCKDHALTTEPQQERRRKALAEPDQWKPYLKDGETPFERFVRDRADTDALLELYKKAIAAPQDQDAKDAARYRWLRDHASNDWLDSGITDDAVDEAINDKSQWRRKP